MNGALKINEINVNYQNHEINFDSNIIEYGRQEFEKSTYEGMINISTNKKHGYGRVIFKDKSLFYDG